VKKTAQKIIIMFFLGFKILGAAQNHFVIAADPDYAPFTMKDKEGEPAGLFIDLWNLWARENNYTVEYRFYDWNDTLKAVKNGEVDFHSGTSKDYAWMYASDPIYEVCTAFYTVGKDVSIREKEDLFDKKIGAIDAYYGKLAEKSCEGTCEVFIYPTYEALIDAALRGDIDAFVDDVDALTYYFIRHDLLEKFVKQPYALRPDNLVYAITNKAHRELLPLINDGLRRLSREDLLTIENRWFPNIPDTYYKRRFGEEPLSRVKVYTILFLVAVIVAALLAYLYRLKIMHRDAVSEALKDELTGLYNKRAFERFFRPDAKQVALVFIDVDHFKEYNDTYGHPAGDELLRRIAAVLKRHLHGDASAYRVGGDEFVVAFLDTNESDVRRFGETIVEAVRAEAIPHESNPFKTATVTVGASLANVPVDRHRIYACADKALYAAKKAGKNRFVFLPCHIESV
jgi:diguanylate cyclase (GGDEF)-like protein